MAERQWIWTDHILLQMDERKVARDLVQSVLAMPDSTVPSGKRIVYQKKAGQKLVRVVADGDRLITVYVTDKVEKYLGRR